jgi:hypothetical protein
MRTMSLGPARHVERRGWRRLHRSLLLGLVGFDRLAAGGAVDALALDLKAPRRRVLADRSEVGREGLAVEPSLADVRYLILDARLVAWVPDARRIGEDAAELDVLGERALKRRRLRVSADDHARRVVEDEATGDAAEERPRGVEPGADVLDGLRERRPHELLAAAR